MDSAVFALVLGIMVVAAAALLAVLAWWAFSSFGPSAGSTSRMHCGYRQGHHGPWTVGTLTYEEDRLINTRPGGLFGSRTQHWERSGLDVSIGSSIDGSEVAGALAGVDMISVPCRYGQQSFELAVTLGRYTALRSWVEAVPPGSHANVA
ncbi:MAG: DUF2550 family protein [Ornithinimicrobium sp.]